MKQHRPDMTEALYEEILGEIRNGIPLSLQLYNNKNNPNFPTAYAVRKFIYATDKSREKYLIAREAGADAMVDETIVIADTERDPQVANTRIKARQWHASKMKPSTYGEKLDVSVTHRIDVAAAIEAARQRTKALDVNSMVDVTPTDVNSVDTLAIANFNDGVDPFG